MSWLLNAIGQLIELVTPNVLSQLTSIFSSFISYWASKSFIKLNCQVMEAEMEANYNTQWGVGHV